MQRHDRLTLLDNFLARDDKPGLTRREFVRNSAGLFLLTAMPLRAQAGCDAATTDTVLKVAFLVAQTAALIGELIKGDMKVDNPNAVCRTYDIAIQLSRIFGGSDQSVVENTVEKSICDPEHAFPLDPWNLVPEQAGNHMLTTLMDGQMFSSDPFGVGG